MPHVSSFLVDDGRPFAEGAALDDGDGARQRSSRAALDSQRRDAKAVAEVSAALAPNQLFLDSGLDADQLRTDTMKRPAAGTATVRDAWHDWMHPHDAAVLPLPAVDHHAEPLDGGAGGGTKGLILKQQKASYTNRFGQVVRLFVDAMPSATGDFRSREGTAVNHNARFERLTGTATRQQPKREVEGVMNEHRTRDDDPEIYERRNALTGVHATSDPNANKTHAQSFEERDWERGTLYDGFNNRLKNEQRVTRPPPTLRATYGEAPPPMRARALVDAMAVTGARRRPSRPELPPTGEQSSRGAAEVRRPRRRRRRCARPGCAPTRCPPQRRTRAQRPSHRNRYPRASSDHKIRRGSQRACRHERSQRRWAATRRGAHRHA